MVNKTRDWDHGVWNLTHGLTLQIDVGRPASIIQADHLVSPETRDWRSWTAREGYENYLDHARLESELLIPLSEGRSVQYRTFDGAHRDFRELVTVEPVGLILVEGFSC